MLRQTLTLSSIALALVACSDAPNQDPGGSVALAAASGGAGAGVNALGRPTVDRPILADPSQAGEGAAVSLADLRYGRRVELWSERAGGGLTRVALDFVIGPDYVGDGVQSRLVTQPVLGTSRLILSADVNDRSGGGRERFLRLAEVASATTASVSDAGLDGTGILTEVPRNAALELRFSDLLDVESIAAAAPRLLVGDPTVAPFEARVIESTLHGGIARRTREFAPSRLILDLAVREVEMDRTRVAVASNPIGLPAREGVAANVALRIGTAGPTALSNLGGARLIPVGSVDLGSGSQDIVRPFQSGSSGGAFSGFLGDQDPPRLVARAAVDLVDAPVQSSSAADEFTLPLVRFASVGCAGQPQVGDVIRQTDLIAEVIAAGSSPMGGEVMNVEVRLLSFPAGWSGPAQWQTDGVGAADYDAPYDTAMDGLRVACLVEVDPPALGAPSAPTRGVQRDASFSLRFNEPIAPESVDDLEASLVGKTPLAASGATLPGDIAVAMLSIGADGESLRNQPLLPLANPQGNAAPYWITPRLGPGAVRDLAGNLLAESPGAIAMSLDPTFPGTDTDTDGRLWRFDAADQGPPVGDDWAGQAQYDFTEERIRPRPVTRFQAVVDNNQALLSQMTPFSQGVQVPLNPLGSRMQTSWRYADMSFQLADPATTNIDVEGLSWSPAGGGVSAESFPEFEINLVHSRWAQDEVVDPATLFPRFPNSGPRTTYETNRLPGDDGAIVHPRQLGYVINPADLVQTTNGTLLMPFPINRIAGEPTRTYTWRDTTIRTRAGLGSAGVEPMSYAQALGQQSAPVPYFSAGEVQTLGLPLLMDFSTWPSGGAGANSLAINLAVNSSSRPFFRAFSAGGVSQSGAIITVDPSTEVTANGGFNPASNPPGAPTFGRDNSVYLGAADFVVRKSVVHSVWVDTGFDSSSRAFVEPIVGPAQQPAGTSVRLDVRGATAVAYQGSGFPDGFNNDNDNDGVVDFVADAQELDLYGDFYSDLEPFPNHDSSRSNPGLAFLPTASGIDDEWQSGVSGLDGARFVQLRLVFESDVETGATPEVSAVGLAWEN